MIKYKVRNIKCDQIFASLRLETIHNKSVSDYFEDVNEKKCQLWHTRDREKKGGGGVIGLDHALSNGQKDPSARVTREVR